MNPGTRHIYQKHQHFKIQTKRRSREKKNAAIMRPGPSEAEKSDDSVQSKVCFFLSGESSLDANYRLRYCFFFFLLFFFLILEASVAETVRFFFLKFPFFFFSLLYDSLGPR